METFSSTFDTVQTAYSVPLALLFVIVWMISLFQVTVGITIFDLLNNWKKRRAILFSCGFLCLHVSAAFGALSIILPDPSVSSSPELRYAEVRGAAEERFGDDVDLLPADDSEHLTAHYDPDSESYTTTIIVADYASHDMSFYDVTVSLDGATTFEEVEEESS